MKEAKKNERELRADIDQIIDDNHNPYEYNIIKDARLRGEVDDRKESTCSRCHTKLGSRKDLFKHLDREGHMVISDCDGNNDEHINRVASKRGLRELCRSDRRFKHLSDHQQQNMDEVDNIN